MSLFCFLWLKIPAELHSKNSPPQEAVESFLTSQKWHRRPHPHMPSLPEASIISCQEPQVCLLRQLNSLDESAQNLKFHLVSFVKSILSQPGADSQKVAVLIIVRRKAWRDAWSWLLSSIQYSQMYPVGSIISGYPFFLLSPELLWCFSSNVSGNLHILGFSQELLMPAGFVCLFVFAFSALPLATHDIFWDKKNGTKAFFFSVPSKQATHGWIWAGNECNCGKVVYLLQIFNH